MGVLTVLNRINAERAAQGLPPAKAKADLGGALRTAQATPIGRAATAFGSAALTAGLGAGALGGLSQVPGADKAIEVYNAGKDKVGGFVERAKAGMPDLPDMPDNPFDLPDGGSIGSGLSGLVRKGFGWAKDNPDAIIGGLSAVQGARQASQASGAREKAMAGLAEPVREDLSFMQDRGNPYAVPPQKAPQKAGGGFKQLARRGA